MNIGDYFRQGACFLDELFVETTGRKIIDRLTNVKLRAIYELPRSDSAPTAFGIDHPDEMEAEFAFERTVRRLGRTPQFGDIFVDCHGDAWSIIGKRRNDDHYRGLNRLVLILSRYIESATTGPKVVNPEAPPVSK